MDTHKKYLRPAAALLGVLLLAAALAMFAKRADNRIAVPPDIPDKKTPSSIVAADVGERVEQLLAEVIETGQVDSSNPYEYLACKAFEELVALGNPAREYMFESFSKSHEDGLKEYIMASACAKIMGIFDDEKGIGINSGREWFYKYLVSFEDADFHIVDADYELFKDTAGKPKLLLPPHTDLKNMDDVIANCILSVNRKAYHMGEKAIEAHKIYHIEEKDGEINLYMLVSFRWFGFENDVFTPVSGGGGEPAKMRLKKSTEGEYIVLEYKTAMDGGMWAESIREMFPGDLAEVVIQGDEKTQKELWDVQVLKAQEYLKKINRTNTPVISRAAREKTDANAARAIYQVTAIRREFPEWNGTREILINAGGKYPGIVIRCVLGTNCRYEGAGEYTITLTKNWGIKINGSQPLSCWKYRVIGERVELIEEQDEDDMIRIIK